MKIKKYILDRTSTFAKSINLSLYEKGDFGFTYDGMEDSLRRELFHTKYLKLNNKTGEVDSSSLPTVCKTIYLDEYLNLKALILETSLSKLENKYYCLRSDHQDDLKLRLQCNFMGNDLSVLEADFEKSCKKKGINYYEGEGDYSYIKDIDFFDKKYYDHIYPRINKTSSVSRLIFSKNNKFTSDFVNLADRNIINVINRDKLAIKVLTLESMSKTKTNRKDTLFVDFSTGEVVYFIYTYKPDYVNHYLLFRNLGNNRFEFVIESLCFNKLLLRDELKDVYFKEGSEFASNSLSDMRYEDFALRYQEFQSDEEVDDEFNSEFLLLEEFKSETDKPVKLDSSLEKVLKPFGYILEGNVLYFKDYETIPLACFGDTYIKIKQNRLATDLSLSNQLSLKDVNKVENTLRGLLENKPSSRLLSLEKLIDEVTMKKFNSNDEEQCLIVEDIEDSLSTLWPIDKKYPVNYLENLVNRYTNWKYNNKVEIKEVVKVVKKRKNIALNEDINITLHAGLRIKERIGNLKDEEKMRLAQEAYAYGFNSVHFYEKDNNMFRFLQYQQNKYPGKTLRLYNDFIYIFSLKPPHDLITCFPAKENYANYLRHMR